ncbi:MAG: tRNA (adenosine(37)-N6)-threonylcarbamoyltransferase complex dimerization subunit type 1 TsaB [Symploca sp. SIO2E6]|nr:tRNA (adenosine(37)-N6)-threonylcarbamoyltransferase complex dimerization subunit type 1 TsaB [Symploca sp. SIO2E6]
MTNNKQQTTNNHNNHGLAFHTTSPQLGLAISNFAEDSRCQTWNLGRDLSTYLHQHLTEFIQPQTWKDLGFIAVAKGPGSFTSTRIGMVTARTLAQQLELPLFAISTLEAIAWFQVVKDTEKIPGRQKAEGRRQKAEEKEEGCKLEGYDNCLGGHDITPNDRDFTLALQMPAQRSQLFTAIYQVSLEDGVLNQLLPDSVMTPDTWQQSLESLNIPYQLVDVPGDLGTTAISVLELAYGRWHQGKQPHWSEALPFYGQHPV